MISRRYAIFVLAVLVIGTAGTRVPLAQTVAPQQQQQQQPPPQTHYHPKFRLPPAIAAIEKQLTPGADGFPEEQTAAALAHRLAELSRALRERPLRAAAITSALLAPEFKGAPLTSRDEVALGTSPQLEVFSARTSPTELTLDRAGFGKELTALTSEFASIDTAELLITAIDVQPTPASSQAAQATSQAVSQAASQARTIVRFDLVGRATQGWRAQRVGRWQLTWRAISNQSNKPSSSPSSSPGSDPPADWRITGWTALDSERSRTSAPAFTEVTEAALGRSASFRQQLRPGLDDWLTRIDAIFAAGAMGHHGVSVGDADGDGLDDLYVSQPAGLPNRLFHNNGDSTFSDVTEAAGLALLDGTSQSLFADIDNDGDQDLILITRTEPLLFLNDGKGHFTQAANAFRFAQRPQGTLTSASMADYDRDGYLDLYLCVYAYVIGASEDKAGPPAPYHDAQHGPPNVLLHNDGHGHFVDVTAEAGLDRHNDRFSFASAWADYDEDGWPDLLVANDFGRKNLYHNDGLVNGRPHFNDVTAAAGVEDYGAGMSAAFLDYDNDGHLDIYTGNMWSAAGQRVTSAPGFKARASAEVRDRYRHHARGNSLFRNNGNGTFADVTLEAHAEFGRWAWSSDAFDFDSDGWQDLYIANGMFTRGEVDGEPPVDVDSLFWRQVVAASPLTRTSATAYDDGWRTINRLLMGNAAQAQHERNVLLHNNGKGGFDEVSGSVGLDLDQDGRSFAVLDLDGDGDPDLVVMAARSSPQLRVFRNDFAAGHAALTLRLIGTKSNRDAVGARVTVETDTARATRLVTAGSGFLSQHSKQLLFGLGHSTRITKVTIAWPSGQAQTLATVPINQRVTIEEGSDALRNEPFRRSPTSASPPSAVEISAAKTSATRSVWLYQPFPAPDFSLRDLDGREHSLAAAAGHPLLLYFWAASAPASRAGLEALSKQRQALLATNATVLALAVDPAEDVAKVRAAALGVAVPVLLSTDEVAGSYNVVHRYLFDRREDLRLPTAFLLDARGAIVKVYSGAISPARIAEDIPTIDAVTPAARLARALPFPGTFLSPPADRSGFQYGLELSEQGYDAAALAVFERVAKVDPSAITLYNLGTLSLKLGQPAAAKAALERALAANADYADAHNTLGVLLAQQGDAAGALPHFRRALAIKPDDADALNNLGYLMFQSGQPQEASALYRRALELQPDFPEALNNLGIYHGQQRDLVQAEAYFTRAVAQRPTYGEAANNLALVLTARGDAPAAIALLERLLKDTPTFEPAYVTLCRLYLKSGRQPEAVRTLESLLQRNPTHPQALEMLRQLQASSSAARPH